MIRSALVLCIAVELITCAGTAFAVPIITGVVETGGDNEATDTVTAKWTGITFPVTVANEPVPGATVGSTYTVGTFGQFSPTFVDRNHRYVHASFPANESVPIPPYLMGGEYIMSGNDNRDNGGYRLDVTLSPLVQEAIVYMLIDNRLGKPEPPDNSTPPALGPGAMQWILDESWIPVMTGNNRAFDPNRPDEVGIDESADGTINQWYSVYAQIVGPGTFTLRQADNGGRNMYGAVVVATSVIPEPGTIGLALAAVLGLLGARWVRRRGN
jgi:hypothetical protein